MNIFIYIGLYQMKYILIQMSYLISIFITSKISEKSQHVFINNKNQKFNTFLLLLIKYYNPGQCQIFFLRTQGDRVRNLVSSMYWGFSIILAIYFSMAIRKSVPHFQEILFFPVRAHPNYCIGTRWLADWSCVRFGQRSRSLF